MFIPLVFTGVIYIHWVAVKHPVYAHMPWPAKAEGNLPNVAGQDVDFDSLKPVRARKDFQAIHGIIGWYSPCLPFGGKK